MIYQRFYIELDDFSQMLLCLGDGLAPGVASTQGGNIAMESMSIRFDNGSESLVFHTKQIYHTLPKPAKTFAFFGSAMSIPLVV